MADSKTPLEADKFYHIYNHAVGSDELFKNDNNYSYFLVLFKKYLLEYVELYAYCLLPNHFHFVIKIRSDQEILSISKRDQNLRKTDNTVSVIVSRQFSHFFNSYAQAFNKQNNRKGSLFANRFKRKQIDNEKYLIRSILYVHLNPVLASFCSDISNWQYSSFNEVLKDDMTFVERNKVLELFDAKQNFIFCHKSELKEPYEGSKPS
jgi:REP element-mobilizing transposase RayT